MVGKLVSGPKMLEIVDLEVGSNEDARRFYAELIASFGIRRVTPSDSDLVFPELLSPDELRELDFRVGQSRGRDVRPQTQE